MYDLIHTFDGILSSDFMNIYQGIKTKQSGTTGMIMLNQINAKVYDELVGIISENSKFMRTLQISSVEMDKILFYQNGVRVNTTKEEDILSKYPSLIAVYDFYTRKQGSYRIRESMYGNVVDDEHCIFKDRILSFTNESKVINSVKKTADDIADLPHIGTMQLKFQVWSQSDWDKIQLDSQYDKRLPIFDYYGGKFRGFGKKTSSGLIKNMLGPYLFVMCITEENMDFAEKYLGAKKSLMCPNVDVFDLVASHIFIKRFNDICVGHFGNKSLHSAYEDFTSSTFGGIKDWMQYADYISEMFEVGKKYPAYNIYIKQASGEEDVAAIKRVYVKKRAQNQSPEESDTHSIYSLSPDTSPDVSPETFMRQQMKQNLGHIKKPTVIPSTNPFRSSGFGSSESFGSDDSIQLEHDEEVAIALFALNLYLKKPAMRHAIQNRKVFFNQQSGEFERVKIIQ
jgi:hypothetical protein